jgi:cytochrome c556
MKVMKAIASHMKVLGEMLSGRAAYDASAAREHALAIYEKLPQGGQSVSSRKPQPSNPG